MGVEALLSVAHNVLSTENEYFNIYIDGVNDQVFSLQTEQLNDVVQSISSLLSKATTRTLGIRLLNKYLDQCSTEVFTRTGYLWTSLVLKSCQGQQDCSSSYEALGKLALKSLQTPELTKTFATTNLAKVYESLTNVSASCVVPALNCVETCLRLYPSSSGPSKRALEKFLARFHDSLDVNVVSYTGKCLHLLQQVSGGEAQSANHKTLWKNYQTQLVGTIHEVYDDMFVNCAEMWDDNVVQERLPSMDKLDLSPEPINKAAQLYVRSHNLINYLITALKEPFPVEKPLLPKMILGVISRGLGVNCNMLHQNAISDNIALALLLPKIHLELLQLLDVAIVILRGHLLPYYNQIMGLIMDVLKTTAEEEHYASNQKPFRQLRAKVYDTISLWCKVHNAGSRCEAIAEQLLQEIMNDITPKSNELTLQVTKAVSKHTSKKMKRQLQKAQNDRSKIGQSSSSVKCSRNLKASHNDERNQLLCVAALRCLQAVLTSAGSFVKPTKIKLLQSSLIQICGNFYELSTDAGCLFSNAQCRLEIYNTLYVLIATPHHLSPPPADIILAVLNNASYRDGNMKVRGQCSWILQNLEKVIHPQKESLVFPIDAREIRNAFIMMGQERLLGNTDNGFSNNDDSEEDEKVDDIAESTILNNEENEDVETQNHINTVSVNNQHEEEPQSVTNDVNNALLTAPDSPETLSDSDSVQSPSQPPVEISSGDESNPIKLRVDEDSYSDDVDIVIVEPFNKKPRIEEESNENGTPPVGFEVKAGNETETKESVIASNGENAEENAITDDEHENAIGNTSTENAIMDIDEDALVDDIAAQFVDDLA